MSDLLIPRGLDELAAGTRNRDRDRDQEAGGTDLLIPRGLEPPARNDPNRSILSDIGRAGLAGAAGFASSLAAAGEYVAGSGGRLTRAREGLEDYAAGQVAQLSPQWQRARSRDWLPGGTNPDGSRAENVWQDGFWGALAAQAVEALPSVALSVIPAGAFARGVALAGAGARGTQLAAGLASGGVTGASVAGEVFQGIAQTLQGMSDQELRQQSEFYRGLRESGVGERDALDQTIRQASGMLPLIGGAIGAVSAGILESGPIARIVTGRSGGVVRSALSGARAESTQEAVEGAAGQDLTQRGQREAINRPYSLRETLQAALQGAAVGAVTGGTLAGVGRGIFGEQPGHTPANPSPNDQDPAAMAAAAAAQPVIPAPGMSAPQALAPVAMTASVDPGVQAAMEAVAPPQQLTSPPPANPLPMPVMGSAPAVDPVATLGPDPTLQGPAPRPTQQALMQRDVLAGAQPTAEMPIAQAVQGALPPAPTPVQTPVATPPVDTLAPTPAPQVAPSGVSAAAGPEPMSPTQTPAAVIPSEPAPERAPSAPEAVAPAPVSKRVLDARRNVEGELVAEAETALVTERGEARDIVGAILDDLQQELGAAEGQSVGQLIRLMRERTQARVQAQAEQRRAASRAEGEPAEADASEPVARARMSAGLIDKALRGEPEAVRQMVDIAARVPRGALGNWYRRNVAPVVQARGQGEPDWVTGLRGFVEGGRRGRMTPTEATARRAEFENWRRQFGQAREQAEANVEADRSAVENVFDSMPAPNRQPFEGAAARYAEMRERLAAAMGTSDTKAQLGRMDGRDTRGSAILTFLQRAKNMTPETARDYVAIEAVLRGNPAEALRLMRETAEVQATGLGTGGAQEGTQEQAAPEQPSSSDADGRDGPAAAPTRSAARAPELLDQEQRPSGRIEKTVEQYEAELARLMPDMSETDRRRAAERMFARQQESQQTKEAATGKPRQMADHPNADLEAAGDALLRGEPIATIYGDMDAVTQLVFPESFGAARAGRDQSRQLRETMTEEALLEGPLARDLWEKLQRVAGDVPILVYSDEAWNRAYPPDQFATAASFTPTTPDAMRLGAKSGVVAIPEGLLRNPSAKFNGVADLREALMHEMVHAATVATVFANSPRRAQLQSLIDTIQRNLRRAGTEPSAALRYALTSPEEMVAVGLTNSDVQQELAAIPLSATDKARIGLVGKFTTAFRGFVAWIRRALGVDVAMDNTLAAVVELGDTALQSQDTQREQLYALGDQGYFVDDQQTRRIANIMAPGGRAFRNVNPGERVGETASNMRQWFSRVGLGMSTLRQMMQMGRDLFTRDDRMNLVDPTGSDSALDQVGNAMLRRGQLAQDELQRFLPAIRALKNLSPQSQQRVSELLIDATMAEVHPDEASAMGGRNAHLKGNDARSIQARARYAELRARWQAMSAAEQRVFADTVQQFQDGHTRLVDSLMRDLVNRWWGAQVDAHMRNPNQPLPVQPADLQGLADRLVRGHDPATGTPGFLTPADEAMLGADLLQAAAKVRERRQMKGPYVPLQRFGDYVVQWEEPGQPVRVYQTEAERTTAIESDPLPATSQRTIYRDAAGNEITGPDPAILNQELGREMNALGPNPTPDEVAEAQRKARTSALRQTRANAASRQYEATFQTKGVAFFETLGEAQAARRELVEQGKQEVTEIDLRREPAARRTALADEDTNRLLDAIGRDPDLPAAYRDQIAESFQRAMLLLTPNRSMNASLVRRRKVLGASRDVSRVMANYGTASANYNASIATSLQVSDGLRSMAAQIREGARTGAAEDTGATLQRRNMLRELEIRLADSPVDTGGHGSTIPALRKLQSATYLYYLMSPSYSLIQMTQPYLLTAPVLGARYGAGRGTAALARAMNDIGMGRVLRGGAREMAANLRTLVTGRESTPQPLLDFVKQNLSRQQDGADLTRMLDQLASDGLVDSTSGLELIRAELTEDGWAGTKLGQMEAFSRAIPAAVEVINRTGSAVAAYRLARSKGRSHEQAVREAREVVDMTQADYSAANTARYMDARRNPLLAPMMTFRKYAQAIYSLIIRQAYLSVRGKTAEEKRIARRTLMGVLGSHALVAGALGLPTEIFSIMAGAVSLLFGADEPWDWERDVRQAMASAFGAETAEIMMRGLPRAIGLDLSGRVGLDSLLFMKDLRDFQRRTMTEFAGELLLGAPGGMIMQALATPNMLAQGQYGRAAEGLVPKALRDALKSFRLVEEGVTTRQGERIDANRQLRADEVLMQALGFTPAAVSETYERREAVQDANRQLSQERTRLMREWRQSDPVDRGRVWERIMEWNRQIPPEGRDSRITRHALQQSLAEQRRRLRTSGATDYLPRGREFLRREGEFANTRDR